MSKRVARKRASTDTAALELERVHLAQAHGEVGTWEWDIASGALRGSAENNRLYGLDGQTLGFDEWIGLIHPEDRQLVETKWAEVLSGIGRLDAEFRVRPGDAWPKETARWVWARGAVHRDEDGAPARIMGVSIDVTSRKRIDGERAKAEAESDKARALNNDFLAMLGHELRNPLGAIANGIELLRNDTTAEHRAWALEMLHRQTLQLKRLVDDILEVSRVAKGQLEVRPEVVSLSASVEAARDAVRRRLETDERELDVRLPPDRIHLFVDPARMQQILGNLLTNAIRYTGSGGHISITAEREDGHVRIRVIDDGEGLSEEHLEVIFEPFVRVSTLHRAGSGLGIGLTLVKKLVELHGGAITASSDGPGTGCTFTITLPVHEGERGRTGDRESEIPRPLRILVIDDNKDLAMGLKKRLEGLGHEITLAHDGPEGIVAAKRTNPHAVLVDVGLPSMDGYHVAERLRQENLPEMRIAAISGFKERGEETLAAEHFDHYFLKPVDAEPLNAWLARVADELGTNSGIS